MIEASDTSAIRRPKFLPSASKSNGSLLKTDPHTSSLNSMKTVDNCPNDEQIPIFLYCKSRSYRNIESTLKNYKRKHKHNLFPNEKVFSNRALLRHQYAHSNVSHMARVEFIIYFE